MHSTAGHITRTREQTQAIRTWRQTTIPACIFFFGHHGHAYHPAFGAPQCKRAVSILPRSWKGIALYSCLKQKDSCRNIQHCMFVICHDFRSNHFDTKQQELHIKSQQHLLSPPKAIASTCQFILYLHELSCWACIIS